MKPKTHINCKNPGCGKLFKRFNTITKYCSNKCQGEVEGRKQAKTKTKIKPLSDKRKVEEAKYQLQRILFLKKPENSKCPITGTKTTDVHHKKGRICNLLLDETYWIALSREGHKYVEEHPEWAKENGFSLSRLETNGDT